MKNWRAFCREFGYSTEVSFGRTLEERRNMSTIVANWLQWNTERLVVTGKNAGKKAMTSASSYRAYLAALQRETANMGEEWKPTPELKMILNRIEAHLGSGRKRKLPIFVAMVDKMRQIGAFDLRDDYDRQTVTILLLTIFGLMRISEVLRLKWRDVNESEIVVCDEVGRTRSEGGARRMLTLTLWDTKTAKGRAGLPEYAVVCDRRERQGRKHKDWDPVEMLNAWDARSQDLGKGKLNDRIFTITRDDYNQRLKLALTAIGIRSERYGTHSGRIGGATMLWEGGASDAEIKELGRWKSESWKIYCRQVKKKCLKLSRMLNTSKLTPGSLVGGELNLIIEVDKSGNRD